MAGGKIASELTIANGVASSVAPHSLDKYGALSLTDEQWRAAWILCETAGDLDAQIQREYVRSATIDPDVEGRVLSILEELEELEDGQVYPPVPDRRAGDTVGRYLLLERIGQGGMGEVYSAEDTELRRTVALKFLPSALEAGDAAAPQVISEARLASRLNHPNIVTVYELIQTPWGLGIAMELVEGQSLRKLLKSTKLSTQRVIHIGRQIASALAAAHEKGIVHRDIKPENVMVREDDDFAKVLDFGLAQNIRDQAAANRSTDLPVGTVRYMSPEQKAARPATSASDIYSLALVLEEAGSWKHPILARMRSTEPLRRPTGREVERLLAELETPSHKRLVLALLLCLLLVVFTGVYWLRSSKNPPDAHLEQVTRFSSGDDVTAAAVSRSGKHLAYATIDGGFFLRDNLTHRVRELTGPEHLACYQLLFPSDRHLLAIGSANEKFEAWQIPLNSGSPRRLSDDVQLAAVSHDGKQIAWLNGSHQVWAGSDPGAPARLLMQLPALTHVAALFWSRDDKRLWFHSLSGCRDGTDHPDITVNPDFCESSDLVTVAPQVSHSTVSIGPLRFSSGFFTSSGFVFLRQDFARRAEGFNIWTLPLNSTTGHVSSLPKQISYFSDAALSALTGTPDGNKLFMVRTDIYAQTYTAEWQAKPKPSLRQLHRLTLEQSTNFPHAWSADNQSVIFESNRNGHYEIFQQNRSHHEPELLASSDRENYYPQLTADGKWILFMSAKNTRDAGFTDFRLMRIPANGGPITQVPLGEPLDEFRCSVPGSGHLCVLRTTHAGQQTYYELDPVTGKGRELGRTSFVLLGLGRWALSADGAHIAIPDPGHAGRFTELHLDPDPSKQWQRSRQIAGIDTIEGMNPGPARGEWLAWGSGTRTVRRVILPPFFLDPSHFAALCFVDSHLHAHLLENDSMHAFGEFSNNGKYMATIHDDLTSNLWSFDH